MAYTSDNVNVMIGKNKGVYGYLLTENSELISTGCVCHRYHLAAEWAGKELPKNIEDFFLDIYYYMEKSTNRLKTFSDFQKACDVPQTKVKKHCPTRWLSLGETCTWVLDNWEPLNEFFSRECEDEKNGATAVNSEEGPRSRKKNVLENLKSRTTKLYVLYLKFVINLFDISNQTLQYEPPQVHRQGRLMARLIRELLEMFVKPCALKYKTVQDVDFSQTVNIVDDKDLMVGQQVRAFLEKEKFSSEKKKQFFSSVKKFLKTACTYLLKNLPLDEPFIKHAAVADIDRRDDAQFSSLLHFIEHFPIILPDGVTTDMLDAEFRKYKYADLPTFPKKTPMDFQWKSLLKLTDDCNAVLLPNLPKVMVRLLSIPHSNASCERIFSIVRKNRTDFRASMSTEVLQSILILKQAGGVCYDQKPTPAVIKACKAATQAHLQS